MREPHASQWLVGRVDWLGGTVRLRFLGWCRLYTGRASRESDKDDPHRALYTEYTRSTRFRCVLISISLATPLLTPHA